MRQIRIFYVILSMCLVPSVHAREAAKPNKANNSVGITTLAIGGGLAVLGAGQIMKIHSADDDDLYEDCNDDGQCERRKWKQDLKDGQQLFWVGHAMGLVGVAILIFKPFSKSIEERSEVKITFGNNFAAVDWSW